MGGHDNGLAYWSDEDWRGACLDDRSRALMAACVGAVVGGLWGWLYLTENGGAVRRRIGPSLDRLPDDIKAVRTSADKTSAVLADVRNILEDVSALGTHA